MSGRGGGSAALPAQLFALTLGCAQMVDVLLRSRDSRLGPGQALSSFLFFFIFRLRTQMSNWNRVFINISCLAIQEWANQNIVNIMEKCHPFPWFRLHHFSHLFKRCEQILTACCGWSQSQDLCLAQPTLGAGLVPNGISVSPGCFQPCPWCQKVGLLPPILTQNEGVLWSRISSKFLEIGANELYCALYTQAKWFCSYLGGDSNRNPW